jgi:large subunit ribosomal protein L10
VRKAGSTYVVVKNTLALRAVEGTALGALSTHFSGMTAVAYSQSDPLALAKVLHEFGKKVPAIKVKAILLEGKPVAGNQLEALASIPSRPELVAKLLGLMQSPLRRLVTVLSGPQRNLAAAVAAIAKKKEEAA